MSIELQADMLQEKWAPVLETEGGITDTHKKSGNSYPLGKSGSSP
jgi:hypothetical protein